MGICSETNCEEKTKAKGLCLSHYYKKYTLPKRRKGRKKNYTIIIGELYSCMNILYKDESYCCLIDNEDVDKVSKLNWHLNKKKGYAYHTFRIKDKTPTIALHKFIMGNNLGEVDHINNNKLDNRKSNLRICTHTQNLYNSKLAKNNTTGIKGLSWDKRMNKWGAQLSVNSQRIVKYFTDKSVAINVITSLRNKYHGEYANHGV
jgi:hypothetical protein